MVGSNICLDQARVFIKNVADWHGINLDKRLSNHQALEEYAGAFPDSPYQPKHWEIKVALQPYERDIQTVDSSDKYLEDRIKTSKKKILIISPYYYQVKKIEALLKDAVKRGVHVELITAKNRDIPCYKDLKNDHILHELIAEGVNVYEIREKYLHMKGLLFDDDHLTFGMLS